MIIVKIEYDSSKITNHDQIIDLRDFVEATTGSVFELEQSGIDMRVRAFGPDDEFDEPLYFTFCVDEKDFHHSLLRIEDDLNISLFDYVRCQLGPHIGYTIRIHKESGTSVQSIT